MNLIFIFTHKSNKELYIDMGLEKSPNFGTVLFCVLKYGCAASAERSLWVCQRIQPRKEGAWH
jgi:hypothetical protein